MVFKLVDAAQKSWRRLDGHNQLPKLIQGVRFTDGIEVAAHPASSQSQPPPPDPSGHHQDSAIALHCPVVNDLLCMTPCRERKHQGIVRLYSSCLIQKLQRLSIGGAFQ